MLTLNLPLVGGVPTLTGTPGQTVNVEGTITSSTELTITNIDYSVTTSEGDVVTVDPTVYLFDPNFGNPIPADTPTTGDLVGITFADIAPSISSVDLTIDYMLSGDVNTYTFTPTFDVDTVEEIAPEPSTMALLALGLCGTVILQRRKIFG